LSELTFNGDDATARLIGNLRSRNTNALAGSGTGVTVKSVISPSVVSPLVAMTSFAPTRDVESPK
jgi:hypothetical protein